MKVNSKTNPHLLFLFVSTAPLFSDLCARKLLQETLQIAGLRIIGMIARRQHLVDPVDGLELLDVRLEAPVACDQHGSVRLDR